MRVQATGNLSWTPINSNSPSPTVSPSVNTTYVVKLDDNGCLNSDSVLVRVTDHVELTVMADTMICRGDTIQLRIKSDGFNYSWLPANQVIDPTRPNPFVVTTNPLTTYTVTANIGSCTDTKSINVSTVPYPFAYAGRDTIICFNSIAHLSGATDGSSINWSPSGDLNNPRILNPVVTPSNTTIYVLSAGDTKGCPKPGIDSVTVTVLPDIVAFAGRDTSVIVNQPLQLTASGGSDYLWTPDFGLSSTKIANPVALFNEINNAVRYRVQVYNEVGCIDSAFITVKIFNTGPTVFVPTAFSPNSDGRNDLLRPIAVGIKQIEFFRIFNRWGQLVYTTSTNGKGWDGTINGVPQATTVYVWMVKAIDYNDKPYFQKGTVTLIK
jgi:gliding motility-associated-like protein